MAVREYTIVDAALFNGARDTDGGIWIRVQDENDHRIMASAIAKQIKNTEAAKGTLSALDPNAPHMVDYIIDSLNRVLASVNGARPASAQLSGTPIGEAIAGAEGKGAKKTRGKKAEKSGDVAGSIEPGADAIQWAEDVPTPRPVKGSSFWTALGFANETPQLVTEVIGYDAENGHFVVESGGGRQSVTFNEEWQQWIGVGAQPSGPATINPEQAETAIKELIAALRAGPADLEDAQFESVVIVAEPLILIVAAANERSTDVRTVVEYIDEFRTLAENAVELAGAIERELDVAAGRAEAEKGKPSAGSATPPAEPESDNDADGGRRREPPRKPAAKKAAKSKSAAGKSAAGKGGGKRKR